MDKGTENVGIADVQTPLRQDHDNNTVTVMIGSSNHNQRIERWWGYCRKAILQCYMDLFKDLETSGILQINNVLHMECLKFCFMNVLRNELKMHAQIWNEHRVRSIKNTRCPSGVPDFLFHHPEYFESSENGKPVDIRKVKLCKDLHNFERNEFGSSDPFSEWALTYMLQNAWGLPNSFKDAYDLFSKLIFDTRPFLLDTRPFLL